MAYNIFYPDGTSASGLWNMPWSRNQVFNATENHFWPGGFGKTHYYCPPSPEGCPGTATTTDQDGNVTTRDFNTHGGIPVGDPPNFSVYAFAPWPADYGVGGGVLQINKTKVKLLTGGKALSQRLNLFQLTCVVGALDPLPAYLNFSSPHDVPPQNIELLGKHLGSDGNLWVTLPDNAERDITPYIPGENYYSFMPGKQKYPVNITASSSTTNANLDTDVPEFCVGQNVTFTLAGLPLGDIVNMVGKWSLPQKYVNHQWQNGELIGDAWVNYGSVNYDIDSSLLENTDHTSCWYVRDPGGHVNVGLILTFNNGQTAIVTAKGDFTVYRPKVTFPYFSTAWVTNIPPMIPMLTNGWLQLGNASQYGGQDEGTLSFYALITSEPPFTGIGNWTQLIKRSASYPNNATDTGGQYDLDTRQFYNTMPTSIANHTGSSASPNPYGAVPFYDSPGVGQWTLWSITIKDDFKTYLEFKPDGDSIWVTLGIVTWGWGATESGTTLLSPTNTPPTYQDSDQFPVWDNTTHGQGGQ